MSWAVRLGIVVLIILVVIGGFVWWGIGVNNHLVTLDENVNAAWGNAKTVDEKAKAAGELEGTLARLLVVAEQYPDLKADQNFRDLQFELSGTENRIAVERQRYNEAVRDYNTAVRRIPDSFIAGLRGFQVKESFEAAPAAAEAPEVDFGTSEKKATDTD